MKTLTRHVSRSFVAGLVALLPITGLVFSVIALEKMVSGTWLPKLPFYFPGFGIIAAGLAIYLIGLAVSTFLGRWAWRRIDVLLHSLPALGQLYRTLKQILGYGDGEDALFKRVVFVPDRDSESDEIGLVTNEVILDGKSHLTVFVPAAPNPTVGRLLFIDGAHVRPCALEVNEALKTMVSIGMVSTAEGDKAE